MHVENHRSTLIIVICLSLDRYRRRTRGISYIKDDLVETDDGGVFAANKTQKPKGGESVSFSNKGTESVTFGNPVFGSSDPSDSRGLIGSELLPDETDTKQQHAYEQVDFTSPMPNEYVP